MGQGGGPGEGPRTRGPTRAEIHPLSRSRLAANRRDENLPLDAKTEVAISQKVRPQKRGTCGERLGSAIYQAYMQRLRLLISLLVTFSKIKLLFEETIYLFTFKDTGT